MALTADGASADELGMAATYEIEITGVKRTEELLAQLDGEIRQLRAASYGPGGVTGASGSDDLLATKFEDAVGRVQGKTEHAMLAAMDQGKQIQTAVLATAITRTGLSGRGRNGEGRLGPGRDDTGAMIDALDRGVEVLREPDTTLVTGWHGWPSGREGYFEFQEKGTNGSKQGLGKAEARRRQRSSNGGGNGIPAANSLGNAIVPVREFLKGELGKGLAN